MRWQMQIGSKLYRVLNNRFWDLFCRHQVASKIFKMRSVEQNLIPYLFFQYQFLSLWLYANTIPIQYGPAAAIKVNQLWLIEFKYKNFCSRRWNTHLLSPRYFFPCYLMLKEGNLLGFLRIIQYLPRDFMSVVIYVAY